MIHKVTLAYRGKWGWNRGYSLIVTVEPHLSGPR